MKPPTVKVLFFDTNILMHYALPQDVDWPQLVGTSQVVLMIHPQLLRELNGLKDRKDEVPRTKKRAATVLRNIGEWFATGSTATLRPNIEGKFEAHSPLADVYERHGLNSDEGDDRHLASVFKHREENPEDDVLFVCHDVGLRLRARTLSIPVVDAPEAHRLPDEPDPQEQRIRDLEREVASFKNRQPLLALRFDNGNTHLEIEKPHPFPKASGDSRKDAREKLSLHTLRLDLQLINEGKAPADDVMVFLEVPSTVLVLSEAAMRRRWELPEIKDPSQILKMAFDKQKESAQQQLMSELMHNMGFSAFSTLTPGIRKLTHQSATEVIEPVIEGVRVRLEVKKLNQNLPPRIASFYLIFKDPETVTSFGITYSLNAQQLAKPTQGRLDIVVKVPDD